MSDPRLEPLAATVSWRFATPRPVAEWKSLLNAFLEGLARSCAAAGPSVIGHIKVLATLPQGGYLRGSVVDITHGADVEAGGELPGGLAELTCTLNVLVYGLPRGEASRIVDSIAHFVAGERGGEVIVEVVRAGQGSYDVRHEIALGGG